MFYLDRSSKQPLFVQLYETIRRQITCGELAKNVKLPSSRTLASDLGVARSTVVSAYEQLVAEGYLSSRSGSGFYIEEVGGISAPSNVDGNSHQKELISSNIQQPLKRSMHPGFPDDRLFPRLAWAKCVSRTARVSPDAMLNTGNRFGDPQLQKSIASYLSEWRGLSVHPDQVLITAGSIDALETCIRTLASPGDITGLENPGYVPLRNIVINQGLSVEWLNITNEGISLPSSRKDRQQPKLAVLTPSHQFPLGGAMPPARRQEFQQWANCNDGWIIEDDYDSEFRFAGRPIPAMASTDVSQRTIYIGTFSKIFSVGLRLGYLVMPANLIGQFSQTLSKFGVKASALPQRALSNFIDSGDLVRHVRKMRRIYGERRRYLTEIINEQFQDYLEFDDHQAGMLLAVRLKHDLDDKEIIRIAHQQKIEISSLSRHYEGPRKLSGLLLGFCGFDEAEMKENMRGPSGNLKILNAVGKMKTLRFLFYLPKSKSVWRIASNHPDIPTESDDPLSYKTDPLL